jgi:hypothetical protein
MKLPLVQISQDEPKDTKENKNGLINLMLTPKYPITAAVSGRRSSLRITSKTKK